MCISDFLENFYFMDFVGRRELLIICIVRFEVIFKYLDDLKFILLKDFLWFNVCDVIFFMGVCECFVLLCVLFVLKNFV